MGHEYKVGDRVRDVRSGYVQEFGEFKGEKVTTGIVVSLVDETDSVRVLFDGCDMCYHCLNGDIEPYTESTPTSADAFRMIHDALYAGVDALLEDCDYEGAMKYAVMMQAIEQFNPKPTT